MQTVQQYAFSSGHEKPAEDRLCGTFLDSRAECASGYKGIQDLRRVPREMFPNGHSDRPLRCDLRDPAKLMWRRSMEIENATVEINKLNLKPGEKYSVCGSDEIDLYGFDET